MLSELTKAAIIAATYTDQLKTKDGKPAIFHAMEVATLLKQAGFDRLAVPGLLHDVVEDSDYYVDRLLEEGISEDNVDLIMYLTRLPYPQETHREYIDDIIGAGPEAIRIKQADCISNLRPAVFDGHESLRERTLKTLARLHEALPLPQVWLDNPYIKKDVKTWT